MPGVVRDSVWRGIAISESFTDLSFLTDIRVVDSKKLVLEGEDDRGEFEFLNVEVLSSQLDAVKAAVTKELRPSWYFHLTDGETLIVLFPGKAMSARRDDGAGLESIRRFGISQGVHPDQITIDTLRRLFDNPYDE